LPACVEMVLAHWGLKRTQAQLAAQLGTDPVVGTPCSRVLRLRLPSFSIAYQQADLDDIRRWLHQNIPVIALVQTSELAYWSRRSAHAVVIVGARETTVWLHDPAFERAPISVPAADFELAHDAMDNRVVLIRPEA
jgi:ABC-type bacteriocin/lantibiotic exporter with double-glycine peptidase domain